MEIPLPEILKYAGVALAAGLISCFGLYLATRITKRTRKMKSPQTISKEASAKILTRMNREVEKSQRKFEREKAKIEARAKKAKRR